MFRIVARLSSIAVTTPRKLAGDQRDVGRLDRHVGAGADRDPDVGLGERGRVVDPVARPSRRSLPSSCSRRTSSALSSGRTSARTRSIPTCRAIASAVRRLSPVIITTSRPEPPQSARSRRGESGFDGVGDRDDAGRRLVDRDVASPSCPRPRGARPSASSGAASMPASLSRRSRSDQHGVGRRRRAQIRGRSPTRTRSPRRERRPRSSAPRDDRPGRGDAPRSARPTPTSRSSSVLGERARRHDVGERRLAPGDRAGLVEDDRPRACAPSRAPRRSGSGCRSAAPLPGPDHDRERRGQAERARAGDDQHRDRARRART